MIINHHLTLAQMQMDIASQPDSLNFQRDESDLINNNKTGATFILHRFNTIEKWAAISN
jgi:hypothetical protein